MTMKQGGISKGCEMFDHALRLMLVQPIALKARGLAVWKGLSPIQPLYCFHHTLVLAYQSEEGCCG
jgi:hypothetical protein